MHCIGYISPDTERNIYSLEPRRPLRALLNGPIEIADFVSRIRMTHLHSVSEDDEQDVSLPQCGVYLFSPILSFLYFRIPVDVQRRKLECIFQ